MTHISTIFFDAGGVLFTAFTPINQRIRNLLLSQNIEKEIIEIALERGKKYWKDFHENDIWLSDWKDEEACWNQYYSIIVDGIQGVNKYSLKKQLFMQTHYSTNCDLYSEVRSVLESLHCKYRLAVISNAYPSMDWIFDYLDIRKYFESITISAFVGDYKPNPKIYEVALKTMMVEAEESLFVDNHINNVEAAIDLGFQGILIDRNENTLKAVEDFLDKNLKKS